jgi:hypothetical protein
MPAPAGSATCVKLEEAVREAPRASHRLPGAGGRSRARTGARTCTVGAGDLADCWHVLREGRLLGFGRRRPMILIRDRLVVPMTRRDADALRCKQLVVGAGIYATSSQPQLLPAGRAGRPFAR